MDLLLVLGQEVDGMHLGLELWVFASEDVLLRLGQVVYVAWVLDLLLHFLVGRRSFDLTLSNALDPVLLHSVVIGHVEVATGSVLLIGVEGSDVSVSVSIPNNSRSVHQIILEFSLVDGTILENDSSSLHLVVLELALQGFLEITVDVLSVTFEFTIDEISFISNVSSLGSENTLAGLFTILEIANVLVFPKVPRFCTFAMFEIHFPVAIIEDAGLLLDEDSLSVSRTIFPVALIKITIGLSQTASAVEHLLNGPSIIDRSILELEGTKSLPGFHLLSQPDRNFE